MRASVSRLARLRPVYAVRGGVSITELSDSIWKGKEPSPDEAVDMLEPVDMPSNRRFGGAGSGSSSITLSDSDSLVSTLNDWCAMGEGGAKVLVGVKVPLAVKDCFDNGETGGDLIGRSDIGEGGTKGNDSRIESARVDVADKTDDPETLLTSKP